MNFKSAVPFATSMLLLAGCAANVAPVAFDRDANSDVKTIEVLAMLEGDIQHRVFNNPAESMGLIGAMGSAISEASRTSKLKEKTEGLDVIAYFQQSLEAALTGRGYTVVWEEPRTHKPGKARSMGGTARDELYRRDSKGMRLKYSVVESGADAQLDVGLFFAGIAAAGVGDEAPYRPTVIAHFRMLTPEGDQVLFQEPVAYHNVLGDKDALTVEPNPDFVYPTWEDLEAEDDAVVADAVREAIDAVTERMVMQL